MVNPNEQRTRQTIRKPSGLSRIFDAKRMLCDKLAACILVEPELEAQFPASIDRDYIDPNLRTMLVLASISMSPISLAKRVWRGFGCRYFGQLIALVDPLDPRANLALVVDFDWYAHQLRELIEIQKQAEQASDRLQSAKNDAASSIARIVGRF